MYSIFSKKNSKIIDKDRISIWIWSKLFYFKYFFVKLINNLKIKLCDYIKSQDLQFKFDQSKEKTIELKFSKIIHKIDIEINEKHNKDESFKCCNEKFIFIIHEKKHNIILGMGKYVK